MPSFSQPGTVDESRPTRQGSEAHTRGGGKTAFDHNEVRQKIAANLAGGHLSNQEDAASGD